MSSPKGRILCTEDDPDTRDLLSLVLSAEGYEVVFAHGANQAVNFGTKQHFDLFLVDSWMPDGITLTTKLREFNIKTPILFYSGAGYDSDKEHARSAGAQRYLVKSVMASLQDVPIVFLSGHGQPQIQAAALAVGEPLPGKNQSILMNSRAS